MGHRATLAPQIMSCVNESPAVQESTIHQRAIVRGSGGNALRTGNAGNEVHGQKVVLQVVVPPREW